ncbi:MAG: DNA/RNA non-specific endonuclease [Lachnospiraceae bacterium]|nr:DNA/RNA non-specific endonuclease [Lachnospiraceae bacterium]
MKRNKKILNGILAAASVATLLFSPAAFTGGYQTIVSTEAKANPLPRGFSYQKSVPKWNGKDPSVKIHGNRPYFTSKELSVKRSYEKYKDLDSMGRCTVAIADIGTDLMPDKERGPIGSVHPTGWHTVKYAGIDGNYLYNRCHLIGYQLTGENANERNLITGTRYLNNEGMLPYEDQVASYLHSNPSDHVLYRVTPVFKGRELLSRGVLMEAESLEDSGKGVRFCVFCYNVQPRVKIDYKDGSSQGVAYQGSTASTREKTRNSRAAQNDNGAHNYVLNTNTKKFHKPSCPSVHQMAAHNKRSVKAKRKTLIREGYSPCGRCRP